jgi:hypothetical protein
MCSLTKKVWIGETQILCCAYFTCLAKLYSIVVERWCDAPFYFLVEQYLSITPSIDAITCEISHLSSTHMVSKQKHDSYQQKTHSRVHKDLHLHQTIPNQKTIIYSSFQYTTKASTSTPGCLPPTPIKQLDADRPESVEEQGLLLLVWRHHITKQYLKDVL